VTGVQGVKLLAVTEDGVDQAPVLMDTAESVYIHGILTPIFTTAPTPVCWPIDTN